MSPETRTAVAFQTFHRCKDREARTEAARRAGRKNGNTLRLALQRCGGWTSSQALTVGTDLEDVQFNSGRARHSRGPLVPLQRLLRLLPRLIQLDDPLSCLG
jgi:hypothetical protein